MKGWLDEDFKMPLKDRIYWWFRRRFQRQTCDGCSKNFSLNRVCPVSGDYWLCHPCFKRWYPEFASD